jgi:hypothetical protein
MIDATLPDSRVFGPSRPKVALLATVLFGSAAACYFLGLAEASSRFALVLSVIFCIVGIGVMICVIRGYPRLTLDRQGVEFATVFNSTRYLWTDIRDIEVARLVGISSP